MKVFHCVSHCHFPSSSGNGLSACGHAGPEESSDKSSLKYAVTRKSIPFLKKMKKIKRRRGGGATAAPRRNKLFNMYYISYPRELRCLTHSLALSAINAFSICASSIIRFIIITV